MNERTEFFNELEQISEQEYLKNFQVPKTKVYHVDDCFISQELRRVETRKYITELNKAYRGNLVSVVEAKAKRYYSDIPIVPYTEYLRELKNAILDTTNIKNKIRRFWVSNGQGLEVGNIIVLNKYPGKATVINEVFQGNKIISCHEYDFNDTLEQLNQLKMNKQIPER